MVPSHFLLPTYKETKKNKKKTPTTHPTTPPPSHSPVTDDLIDVHVALRARPSLPHHQWEMVIKPALVHFSGGLHDGSSQFLLQPVVLRVDGSTGFLQVAKGVDHRDLKKKKKKKGSGAEGNTVQRRFKEV